MKVHLNLTVSDFGPKGQFSNGAPVFVRVREENEVVEVNTSVENMTELGITQKVWISKYQFRKLQNSPLSTAKLVDSATIRIYEH